MSASNLRSIALLAGFALSLLAARFGESDSIVQWLPAAFPVLAALVVAAELKSRAASERFLSGNRFLAVILLFSPAAVWMYPAQFGFSSSKSLAMLVWWVTSAVLIVLIGRSIYNREDKAGLAS
jgi:uncharacterized membrane protein (GlpM family)